MSSSEEPRIGAAAVGVIVHDGHILLEPMAWWLNVGLMWRPIGGYINFGEYAADTVVREFREELSRDVEVIRLLDVYENIVTFEVDSGPLEVHETVFLYELRFAAQHRPLDLEPLPSFEQDAPAGDEHSTAYWLPISELRAGEHPVFPLNLVTMLEPLFDQGRGVATIRQNHRQFRGGRA